MEKELVIMDDPIDNIEKIPIERTLEWFKDICPKSYKGPIIIIKSRMHDDSKDTETKRQD